MNSPSPVWLFRASLFFILVLLSISAYIFWSRRQTVRAWEKQASPSAASAQDQLLIDGARESQGLLWLLIQKMGAMNQSKDDEDNASLVFLLRAAGYREAGTVGIFRGLQILLGLGALALVTVIPKSLLNFPSTVSLLALYVGIGCLGYYAPRLWLRAAVSSRQAEIARGLPDALDLMVICVEAGLGLDMAIDRVTTSIKSVHAALGEELQLLTLELRAGVPRVTALRNLAKRTNVLDLRSLVAVLVQTERFGTSIAQALRVQSDMMRTERELKAEEAAAKLPVKLMFPLIFFIFPVLFIIILGPPVLQVVRNLLPVLGKQ